MKTKKVVIGAMAAAMLSLSVCSIAPTFAADDTVQITVGSATVEAGEQFSIDVTISDIPAEGIQACQFSLDFDSSIITIDSVAEGDLVKSVKSDPTSSVIPSFNSIVNDEKGYVNFMWASSMSESDYLLNGEGVFCTITGTVASSASGTTEIKVAPTVRETYTDSGIANEDIDVGYSKNGEKVRYNVETTNGVITIGDGASSSLKGDANCDGFVNIADATTIVQFLANPDKYPLSKQGMINADVDDAAGISGLDAFKLQQLEAGVITEL